MALLGGIFSGASQAQQDELQAVTRYAAVPACIVQIYQFDGWLSAALSQAKMVTGGMTSIVVPVQGAPLTTAAAMDFTGSFSAPSGQTGIKQASGVLKGVIVPIGFQGMEGIIQDNAALIPLVEARMNDAGNQVADYMSSQAWTNTSDININITGWPAIGSATNTYLGLDRTVETYMQACLRTGGAITRQMMLASIIDGMQFGLGEMPNVGFLSVGDWYALAADFIADETYQVQPGTGFDKSEGRGGFTALSVAGVPHFMSTRLANGTAYHYNTRYDHMYIHQMAPFAFTGFASTLPALSIGYIGCLVAILEHVNVKPRTVCVTSSLTGGMTVTAAP